MNCFLRLSGLGLLAIFAACACTSPGPPRSPAAGADPSVATTASVPVAAGSTGHPPLPLDCGLPIDGAVELLRPGGLIMLGELHGTQQIPAFVGDLACLGVRQGLAVRVGVEVPRREGPSIARYLDSAGNPSDRHALLDAEHWQRVEQDGRSSVATVALIDRIRVLRAGGADIDLFPFDANAWAEWNERDRAMADSIVAHAATEPHAVVLTLSGNLHNRTVVGLPWDANAIPMGVHVHQVRPDALSLDVRYQDGTAWICQTSSCGTSPVSGSIAGAGRRIERFTTPDEFGHNGLFAVGPIEAAWPAVGEAAVAD